MDLTWLRFTDIINIGEIWDKNTVYFQITEWSPWQQNIFMEFIQMSFHLPSMMIKRFFWFQQTSMKQRSTCITILLLWKRIFRILFILIWFSKLKMYSIHRDSSNNTIRLARFWHQKSNKTSKLTQVVYGKFLFCKTLHNLCKKLTFALKKGLLKESLETRLNGFTLRSLPMNFLDWLYKAKLWNLL